MKEESNVMVIAQRMLSGASPSSSTPHSPAAQPPLPTPSPYSFSVASTRLRSRPSLYTYDITLRSLALLFSFISALSLAVPSPTRTKRGISRLRDNPQLMYCFTVSILAFIYSAFQLFKRVCDIAYGGVLISDRTSDYLSFILDQIKLSKTKFSKAECLTVGRLPPCVLFFSNYTSYSTDGRPYHSLEGSYYCCLHVIYCLRGPCNLCTLIRLQAVQKDHMVMHRELNIDFISRIDKANIA
ncbi:hypothetical protein BC332_00350 [Capsicum chinense]|nr:hypothetical protein BC332_00350 [Capsicum chinense]